MASETTTTNYPGNLEAITKITVVGSGCLTGIYVNYKQIHGPLQWERYFIVDKEGIIADDNVLVILEPMDEWGVTGFTTQRAVSIEEKIPN